MARRRKRIKKSRACDGKKKLTQTEAVAMAISLQKRRGAIVRGYRCVFHCKLPNGSVAWHVGHVPMRKP